MDGISGMARRLLQLPPHLTPVLTSHWPAATLSHVAFASRELHAVLRPALRLCLADACASAAAVAHEAAVVRSLVACAGADLPSADLARRLLRGAAAAVEAAARGQCRRTEERHPDDCLECSYLGLTGEVRAETSLGLVDIDFQVHKMWRDDACLHLELHRGSYDVAAGRVRGIQLLSSTPDVALYG
mmetsp:Transcript_30966/g.92114  ORF Transcript_30966/g.92114 Transcript_30966/m.92114 type:complete len:187 (-) Transcript_30966:13-573(-)